MAERDPRDNHPQDMALIGAGHGFVSTAPTLHGDSAVALRPCAKLHRKNPTETTGCRWQPRLVGAGPFLGNEVGPFSGMKVWRQHTDTRQQSSAQSVTDGTITGMRRRSERERTRESACAERGS